MKKRSNGRPTLKEQERFIRNILNHGTVGQVEKVMEALNDPELDPRVRRIIEKLSERASEARQLYYGDVINNASKVKK